MYLDPCIADEGPVLALAVAPLIIHKESICAEVYTGAFVVHVPCDPAKFIANPFVKVSSKVNSS
jgi:hypothetical protein